MISQGVTFVQVSCLVFMKPLDEHLPCTNLQIYQRPWHLNDWQDTGRAGKSVESYTSPTVDAGVHARHIDTKQFYLECIFHFSHHTLDISLITEHNQTGDHVGIPGEIIALPEHPKHFDKSL
jgi:hypothetical protein